MDKEVLIISEDKSSIGLLKYVKSSKEFTSDGVISPEGLENVTKRLKKQYKCIVFQPIYFPPKYEKIQEHMEKFQMEPEHFGKKAITDIIRAEDSSCKDTYLFVYLTTPRGEVSPYCRKKYLEAGADEVINRSKVDREKLVTIIKEYINNNS